MIQTAKSAEEFLELYQLMNAEAAKLAQAPPVMHMDNDPVEIELISAMPTPAVHTPVETPTTPASSSSNGDLLSTICSNYTKDEAMASDLRESIMEILKSDSSDDELQATLADLLGYDHLDVVIELIQRRTELASEVSVLFFFAL